MGIFASKAHETEEEQEHRRQQQAWDEETEEEKERWRHRLAQYEAIDRQQVLERDREAREREQRHTQAKADYRRQLLEWRGDDTTSVDGETEGSCTRFNRLNIALALRFVGEHPESTKWIVHESNRTHYQSGRKYASTYLVGKFVCKNGEVQSAGSKAQTNRYLKQKKKQRRKTCSQWSSGKIFVEVFVKDAGNQFKFDVIVWNQACRKCDSVVSPTFTDDDKAVFMTRIFSKLELLLEFRRELRNGRDFNGKETAPHEQALCCACRAGKCQVANQRLRVWSKTICLPICLLSTVEVLLTTSHSVFKSNAKVRSSMSAFLAHRDAVERWTGEDESIGKMCSQTRFNRLNNQLILRMIKDEPHVQIPMVHDQSVSADRRAGSDRNYASTYLVGRFNCPNAVCSGWSSGKVFTEIFTMNTGSEWKFDVIVWNQACRKCKGNVSCTVDEETYLERVYSKLQLLFGLRDSMRLDTKVEKKTPPHDQRLCCACKAGKCQRS